jgi:hypothetical protein
MLMMLRSMLAMLPRLQAESREYAEGADNVTEIHCAGRQQTRGSRQQIAHDKEYRGHGLLAQVYQ